MNGDIDYMRRALTLAARGRGFVEPNPMVGCVLVANGRIIAEGYHERFGGPHAERQALAACRSSPAGATAYVTLEPCCHSKKKTPPCVPALIDAKVARVVAACVDPNPLVSGQGLHQLAAAGISIESGLLEAEAMQLNAPFFARVRHNRPYVTLKWAQSADGKVAGPGGARMQISNAASMQLVHSLRARSDAILVGIGTALADDPLLTTRGVASIRPLRRVVLDTHLRLPTDSQLARTAQQSPLLIYCTTIGRDPDRAAALAARGAEIIAVEPASDGRPSLPAVLHDLSNRQVTHLLVEGGPTVAARFLADNLADRVWVFTAPMRIDSPAAPAAPQVDFPISGEIDLAGDCLRERLNPHSPIFFHNSPSADLAVQSA